MTLSWTRTRRGRAIAAAVLAGWLCGCANNREFRQGNVTFTASNRRGGEWRYFKIELGHADRPYEGKPAWTIAPEGLPEFRTDALTVQEIYEKMGGVASPSFPRGYRSGTDDWSDAAQEVRCGDTLVFIVEGGRIRRIMLMHKGRFKTSGGDAWHSLPLREDELRAVLGEPDAVEEWFRE